MNRNGCHSVKTRTSCDFISLFTLGKLCSRSCCKYCENRPGF